MLGGMMQDLWETCSLGTAAESQVEYPIMFLMTEEQYANAAELSLLASQLKCILDPLKSHADFVI